MLDGCCDKTKELRRRNVAMDKSRGGGLTPLHMLLYSEDMRISKILRRLVLENNPTAASDLCKKLEVAVRNQTNASYICRSFEFLLESMIVVLKQCPEECAEQASTVFGLIGYINRSEFGIYQNYITKTYESNKRLQKYVMMALKTTISCDAVNLDLTIYSERLLTALKDYLENAEAADNFVAVSETIAEFSKNYKRIFECHFTDIVDIIVGWHLEVDQRHMLKLHCSLVLQQFSQYFIQKMDFTYGLLGQFLEDIMTFGEDIAAETSTAKSRRKAEVRIGAFVGAFNSILKSLSNRTDFVGLSGDQEIITDALRVITKAAKQSLSILLASEETILNINDFLCLIFVNDYSNSTTLKMLTIEEIVELQLQQFQYFHERQQFSLLYLILCIIRRLRTQMPCSLVTLIFKTENNPLSTLKLIKNNKLYRLYLKLYHDVLIIKNVPLLQEAYKHIKLDINRAIEIFELKDMKQIAIAESNLNFYLAALSALATQTSSIIGMYALYPSIVDLLISNCQAANLQLWQRHPILHAALLNVIVVHCQKNHNYRSTSRLLLTEHIPEHAALDEKLSPTSENFSTILKFLANILSEVKQIPNTNVLSILLNWLEHLLAECKNSAVILQHNTDFINIGKAIGLAALKSPLESALCIEILLKYSVINPDILASFRDVTISLIDSVDPKVRHVYSIVFARLPLDVSLNQVRGLNNSLPQSKNQTYELQQWYRCTTHFSPLRPKYFKPFLKCIELSTNSSLSQQQSQMELDQLFLMVFSKSWIEQCREVAIEYQQLALSSAKMLTSWMQYEVARYCVQNKLRTTVGKPQDTFLAIEALIMKYARVLASKHDRLNKDADTNVSFDQLSKVQRNSRILLGFLENLEKHIYSAAEGTAFAFLPLEKPAKTFFRINAHTCNEWFKRIRTAVNLVAMHSTEPEMVIRYSEYILNAEEQSDLHMERTIICLVQSLLICGETDTLQGLYLWVKAKTNNKSYMWIQHASEQSAGHKEQAAEGYAKVLVENQDKILDVALKEFLITQLLNCLFYTCQWSKMREILKIYESSSKEESYISKMRSSKYLDMIEALYYGYNNPKSGAKVSQALLSLSEWPNTYSNELDGNICFSSYSLLNKIEDTCIAKITSNREMENEIQHVIHCGLQESLRDDFSLEKNSQLQDFIILNHVFQKLNDNEDLSCTALDYCQKPLDQSTTVLTKCLLWTLLFEQREIRNGNEGTQQSKHHALYLNIVASARREGNLNFCRTMLERFFAIKGFSESSLLYLSKNLKNNVYTIDLEDTDLLRGFSEISKYLYSSSTASHQMEAIHLGAAYCSQIIQQVSQFPQLQYPETSTKMLLTMADWLTQRNISNMIESPQLQQLLNRLPDVALHLTCEKTNSSMISSTEIAVGKLINAATFQENDSGEAWCAFGNWCYRWGKKVFEAKNSVKYSKRLSQHDLTAIKAIVGGETLDVEVINKLEMILNSHQLNVCDSVDDIENSNVVLSIDLIIHDLRKINIFSNMPLEQIASIIEIWQQAHRSIYAYYEMATKAYFKYLSIETDAHSEDLSRRECTVGDISTFVTVTLRILRLIVKHAIGLQEVLEEGLRTTPLRPWKIIIPQLFSRLNHHEPYVRKSVSELLCRLAKDRPHLIIFPAVVGAHQELQTELPQYDAHRPIDDSNSFANIPLKNKTADALSTCFGSLLMTLSQQVPETVLHVQLLVKELKRITLLWEEYWTHALAQLHAEYSSLFTALEIESKNCLVSSYSECIKLKYEILLNHVVKDLQKIANVTEKPAETNYERTFQDRYSSYITNLISELKNPFNASKPNEGWIKIKQLYNVFQQRSIRGSVSSTLKLTDLSPVLASMHNTSISMLGIDTFEKHPIHIKSVDNTVYILPTKTKPKKLSFSGSDGRKYTYLFKGLEDLHLDERIMQFLSISNSMMERSKDRLTATTNLFKAQHYSVIPLGPQSGLISWVDGVTPLFAIYKKWQQRDSALKQQLNERPSTAGAQKNVQQLSVLPATRPSEIFYNKLTPLLAEQKLKVTDPRKQWPLSVLRRVLEELSKETPKYLLAKELWCHAASAAEWRKSVRNYSLSVAVMSVIGYIIGLGDRHLDNVLIKLSTGEIVHIDYNVCFEKGKTLRVPEKVPFRMTPNLVEALGITGIEGPFRLGCEHVLKTLRKERETLLTLLEAFVYDPLVDWTISDDGTQTVTRYTSANVASLRVAAIANHYTTDSIKDSSFSIPFSNQDEFGYRKKDGVCEFSRQTIEIRFNEIKQYWTQYKDALISKLSNVASNIDVLVKKRETILQTESERNNLTKQLAMIRELEALGSAMGSHALNTITQRYSIFKQNTEALDVVMRNARMYHNDIKTLLEQYFGRLLMPSVAFDLAHLQMQLHDQQQQSLVLSNEFDIVREFLATEKSLPESFYDECKFARNEMSQVIKQESHIANDCLELLLKYASVMQYYPRSRLEQSRLVRLKQLYQEQLLDDKQRDTVILPRDIFVQFETNLEDMLEKPWELQYSAAMEKIWIELNFDLHRAINDFNDLKKLTVIPLEVAVTDIQSFVSTCSQQHKQTLQRCMLQILAKANDNFLLFEKTALEKSEISLLLDRQMDYIDITLGLCRTVVLSTCQSDNDDASSAALEILHSALFLLRKLKSAFELPLSERIVRLFMLDTHFELQSYLDTMCTASNGPIKFSKLLQEDTTLDEFFTLLAELYGLFDEFENQFNKLQQVAEDILKQMFDCDYKYFVQSRITLIGDFKILSIELKHKTIREIFRTARQHVASLNANNIQNNIYNIRLISSPMSDYINELQQRFLGGLTSLFAHALYSSFDRSLNLEAAVVDEANDVLNQSLCQNLLMSLQHNSNLKNQQLQVWLNTKWVEHYTLVATAHFWVNEEILRCDSHLFYGHIIYKEKLLSSLQSASQSLAMLKHSLTKIQTVLEEHTTTVTKHLKRSSVVNSDDYRNLINMHDVFHDCVNQQNQNYSFHLHFSIQLLEQSEIVLQFEKRTSNGEDVNMLEDIVKQWQHASSLCVQSGSAITAVEQSIVQLLDPEDKIDQCWIENISGLLDEITFSVQRKLAGLEHEEKLIEDILNAEGHQLQALIDTPIRMQIRHLLKMISKNDKKPSLCQNGEIPTRPATGTQIRELQHMFKLFYVKLGELQLQLIGRDFDLITTLPEMKLAISDLLCAAEQNQIELFELVERLVHNNNNNKSLTSPVSSPKGNAAVNGADKDKKVDSQCEQKRNVYAVSVWKRIRMKLEGRDPDSNRRSTIPEQVHFIIREAMNPDNLAVLYEGWTPWV